MTQSLVSCQSTMTVYHEPCTKPPWVCHLKHHLAYPTDTEVGTGSGFVWYTSIQFPSNIPAVFWRDWANFYTAYQKWVRMSVTVQPCQKWLFSDYNLSQWNFRKWCLIVLIFFSWWLVISFVCLLGTQLSLSVKCMFITYSCISIGLFLYFCSVNLFL